jgi:hypothetical protein
MHENVLGDGLCGASSLQNDRLWNWGRIRKLCDTIRDGNIFDFNGGLVGHLQDAGLVRKDGDSTPPEFTRLLS